MHENVHVLVAIDTGIIFQTMKKFGDLIPRMLQQKETFNFLGHILRLVSYRLVICWFISWWCTQVDCFILSKNVRSSTACLGLGTEGVGWGLLLRKTTRAYREKYMM